MTAREFWKEFCSTFGLDPATPHQVWYFGNERRMARELAELVLNGKKIATASLAETNRLEPENAPVDDGYSVVTDFEGSPMCVIQTIEIRHLPFSKVDVQFAFDEGEGDQSYEYWHGVHWDYFTREAAERGFEFNENSIVCCERFRLLFPR